jgi:hypothetical protein
VTAERIDEMLSGISIDVEKAQACVARVRAEPLEAVGRAFVKNVSDILNLLSLPLVLLCRGRHASHDLVFFTQALVKTKNVSKYPEVEAARHEVASEAKRLRHEALETGQLSARVVEEASQELREMLQIEDISQSARVLLSSSTSIAWTAFECLATDLWVAALDSRPTTLAQRALKSLPGEDQLDGISGKAVAVWQLARHGFDLRSCMGRLLKPKFDLTSLSNIRKAYSGAFEKSMQLDVLFTTQDLNLLEASRHVIVHRGGIVDEEFASRTKTMGIGYTVGAPLPLDGKMVSRLANAGVDAGCQLLTFVEGWLTANPA